MLLSMQSFGYTGQPSKKSQRPFGSRHANHHPIASGLAWLLRYGGMQKTERKRSSRCIFLSYAPRSFASAPLLVSDTIHPMRARMSYVVVTVLLICLVCPVMQMFDRWDHEVQTGQDTESALVVVALCLGVTFSLVQAILKLYLGSPSVRKKTDCSPLSSSRQILIGAATSVLVSESPPPTILRI
ncbi:MAG: hypothetical protein DMG30_13385 [Acidobacteria bacterium]|nr:MAG: hypothetical protein DMG30_13385 [Acidobacteriota bacterium]